jgi:hypothetical protein
MWVDVDGMLGGSPTAGVVLLGGCDKTVPAQLMGAISANKPALMVTAGPRPVPYYRGTDFTIDDLWPVIGEAGGGGIKAARDFAAAGGPATGKWTSPPSPQFILSIALLGLVYMAMANITGLFGFQEWTAENRSNVLFLIVGTAIGAVTGFWFGTSHSSQRKDQLLGSRQ